MKKSQIKLKRTESILKELLPEAFGSLDDERINSLTVTNVVCSKGRYDAKVYLDKTGLTELEQREAVSQLKRVIPYIKQYIRESEGWYKAPNFTFEFDEEIDRIGRMERLFKQVNKELNSENRE
jgi:ribosome-binding factor A